MDSIAADSADNTRPDFSALYEENYRRIFNYILYGTGNIDTALDLTSETFFKALRAWPGFEHRGISPVAWLIKIASRELAMFYRRQGRLRRFAPSLEFNEEVAGVRRQVVEAEVLAAQRELESREDFLVLSPLIRKLSSKYREVIFLRFFAGMSLDEISESLDRPVGTVKAQLHRALKRIRADLQPSGTIEHSLEMDLDSKAVTPGPRQEAD
jgi:RNA polymerase sigma factor (sigma-70 family)